MILRRRIDRFQLLDEVASGASGTIYEALDEVSGARVAVKLIRPLGHVDAARFAREVRVLAKVSHPGVVGYIDHGHTPDGDAYLVMEWLEGEDLRERLGRAGLTMNETVAMGRRVAGALSAVHAEGLVHRDVKPGNIFLPGKRPDEATIIDFGLARTDESATAVTQTGLVVGTPAYMAPEQARGQREIDGRADVFSLGCVLYKCLAGRAPFEGSSVMAVLTKVLLEDPPRLRALRAEMPPALDELVAAMLQKDPARRPQRAAAVAEALGALGPLGPVGESSEPAPPSRAFSGLTGGEQRVMAMVFVGAAGEETIPESGMRPTEAALPPLAGEAIGLLAREHGGQIDRLADGTSVVTLSGVGVATDQAARAAKFALALRAVLPAVPMALATGRSDVARRFPVGDAIDRAARLLGRSAEAARSALRSGRELPSAIAVDAVTAALLGARFHVVAGDGGLSLEGSRERELGARTLLGQTTPMVGREWELSSIETLFFDCLEEPLARPVLVTAPAGMGKSRLGHEAVRALRRRVPDLEVWIGRGDPLRADSALGLLGDVIRSACGLQEGEPLDTRRRRLVERAGERVPPQTADFLGEIVETPFPDDTTSALRAARGDPRLMSEQIRAAWEALLAAECASRPLLVVLEDLHWADLATVRFVEAALSRLERRPWMVLGLARPEVHSRFPRLWIERHVQEIRLKPLPRRAGERLVRQVLGESADPETVSRVLGKAEGNAFYLEELIRAVAQDAGAGPLPETVLAMVQARLEGLDAEARRVLRAASIFGDVFWTGGVAALLGEALPDGWEEGLLAREWLVKRPESRFAGERELGFRHSLLRDGAYATLTEADRALGHQLAGTWLEAHGEHDGMELAQHFALAGEAFAARAADCYLAAAGQALRGGAPHTAIARADRALAGGASNDGAARRRNPAPRRPTICARGRSDPALRGARLADRLGPRRRGRDGGGPSARLPGSAAWIHANTILQTASFVGGRPLEGLAALAALAGVEPAPEAAGQVTPALAVGVLVLCLAGQFEVARGVLDARRRDGRARRRRPQRPGLAGPRPHLLGGVARRRLLGRPRRGTRRARHLHRGRRRPARPLRRDVRGHVSLVPGDARRGRARAPGDARRRRRAPDGHDRVALPDGGAHRPRRARRGADPRRGAAPAHAPRTAPAPRRRSARGRGALAPRRDRRPVRRRGHGRARARREPRRAPRRPPRLADRRGAPGLGVARRGPRGRGARPLAGGARRAARAGRAGAARGAGAARLRRGAGRGRAARGVVGRDRRDARRSPGAGGAHRRRCGTARVPVGRRRERAPHRAQRRARVLQPRAARE